MAFVLYSSLQILFVAQSRSSMDGQRDTRCRSSVKPLGVSAQCQGEGPLAGPAPASDRNRQHNLLPVTLYSVVCCVRGTECTNSGVHTTEFTRVPESTGMCEH